MIWYVQETKQIISNNQKDYVDSKLWKDVIIDELKIYIAIYFTMGEFIKTFF